MPASIASAAMIAQQVGGKAVRDAFFLSSFRVSALPSMMAVGAALSLATLLTMSRLMALWSPRKVVPALFGVNAAMLSAIWLLALRSPRGAAIGLYIDTAVLGPVVISGFWSLVNERFPPHTARSAVARIASGGTVGGVLGGLSTWRLSTAVPVSTAIVFLAASNAVCVAGVLAIGTHDGTAQANAEEAADVSPISALRKVPFLRTLALLVMLGSACSTLLDYVFSAQATASYGSGAHLLTFFSLFGLAVSVASLTLQLSLGRFAMEKLGLAVNIAVLPGIIIMGSALGLAVPGLLSASLLRGAEMVQRNTLFRSAYELLYTPLPAPSKRSTKAFIDVGFDRLGTMLGSGITMGALALVPHAQRSLLWGVVVLAFATLPVARWLHRGYVDALEQGLREGAQKLRSGPISSRPSVPLDDRTRDRLIDKIEAIRNPEDREGTARRTLARGPELVQNAKGLLLGAPSRVRAALAGWSDEQRALTDLAIAHLAHPELHVEARAALGSVAPRVVGHLIDALADPEMDFAVRRRIPQLLGSCRTQRAVDGLLLGVGDERFEVRFACARALLKITDNNSAVSLRREAVIEAVQKEVARAVPPAGELDDSLADDDQPWSLTDALQVDRANRRLEHIFSILALLLEREPLRLAFRALHHENGRRRGTALEYLQTVMPEELRDSLWPLLSEAGPLPAPREAAQVLAELALNVEVPANARELDDGTAREPLSASSDPPPDTSGK